MKLLILAVLAAAVAAENSYVVVAPSKVRPGMQFSVSVNILRATGNVNVVASLVRSHDNQQHGTNSATLTAGTPKAIDIQVPADLPSGAYDLHVTGSGGLTFDNKTRVTYSSKAMSVLVQTDKAMYKPGQTVNFRVLAVNPDLSVYTGSMDIEMFDANSNKIKQWLGVVAEGEGVVTKALPLSSQPVLGDWKIKVTAQNAVEEKKFTIAEYVLPKFEVTVELPSYILESAASVPVTVRAKYTYGKPVLGSVVVIGEVHRSYYYSGHRQVQHTTQLNENGTAVVNFPMSELHTLSSSLNQQTLNFSATVTETLTGSMLKGTASVKAYNQDYKLEFLTSNPKTFKPGLRYVAYVKVGQPDGLPLAGTTSSPVTVTATVTAELPETGTTPYAYYQPRTTTFSLTPLSLAVPANGLVALELDVPANATRVNLHATFKQGSGSGQSVSAYSNVDKSYSPSNNYMQLFLRSTGQLHAGGQVSFEMKATEGVDTLVYQVMSRGSIVATGTVSAGGATSALFSLPVQANMAPNARFVLYYVRADGEIVTDSISFDVSGAFRNLVTVALNTTEAEPAQEVEVKVTASAHSTAFLLAVDQSVLLLKGGNDITQGQVIDELKSFDTTNVHHNNFQFPRFGWGPYIEYYGGSDANQIFKNAGVVVMTDGLVYHYVEPFRPCKRCFFPRLRFNGGFGLAMPMRAPQLKVAARPMMAGASFSMTDSAPSGGSELQEVERVRTVFPETWLWSNATVRDDGTASISTTVPDTITSWVASAFAVSSSTGLGVAPTSAKLRVFRPFFVTLNLPYSVVRGEQVVVQAIVFNYLDTDQDVRVSMAQSQDFFNIVMDASGNENMVRQDTVKNVRVAAGEGKSVYFPIAPATLGSIELVVSAQSTQAADAVRRRLLVEAEGVPKEMSVSVLVDLSNTNSFSKTVHIALPPNVVADSTTARVTAIGDLMGPTVNGLDSLLRMPTGCGEQTMIGLAPDVFVTSYLTATNQLTAEIEDKAISFMEQGYQRELTYQHKDGSFSAFGERDGSGSMWLTAFVAKTFHQAKPYMFIDDQVIAKALSWMVARQSPDGSFPEPGRVIHKNMQGGAGNGTGLTAFVLISLLENSDIQGGLSQQVTQAQAKAVTYLKGKLASINDDYLLAMTTYALTLAGDSAATAALQTLNSHAVNKDGFRFWHKEPAQTPTAGRHTWRSPQAAASDVEMTSYALLTYAAKNDVTEGLTILKWVASQRNPRGGYSSTQDTILALQSLSEFARQVYSNNFNLQLDIHAGNFRQQFTVTQTNALVLQSAQLPTVPSSLTVTGTGSGIALVEVGVFFNVEAEVEEPRFEVTVTLEKDSLNELRIQACSRWLAEGSSGMAVMEVGVPAGFEVDTTTMKSPGVLKRTEVQDRKVVLYFDEVGSSAVCTTLTVTRVKMVSKSQPVAVRIYDYYEPDNQATIFYESALLKDSNVCDVCPECGCPGPNVIRR